MAEDLQTILQTRFGTDASAAEELSANPLMASMAGRASCRDFKDLDVPDAVVETLCAVALSSPTKSDLQQRDIIIVRSAPLKANLLALVGDQGWTVSAPVFLVICGNNRRQRQVQAWRGHAFANDHLDAFFNSAVDAAIALSAFVTAAEAIGLGCCPISAVRNEAEACSDLLGLPDHVFPVAGLALGHPATEAPDISLRLPLGDTVHIDRFDESTIEAGVQDYDARRRDAQPYSAQRRTDIYGEVEPYTWSEDKARQYSLPERADFGRFVRRKGFNLD